MVEEIGKDAFIAPNIGKIPLEKLKWAVEGTGEELIFKEWFVLTDQTGSRDFVKLVYIHSAEPDGGGFTGIIIDIIDENYQPDTPCTNPPVSITCVHFVLDNAGVETLSSEIAEPALTALKTLISPPWCEEYKEVLCIAGGILLLFFILAMIKGK